MNELLLGLADDELVIGWRDSEWTGIAPMLEEDVAFSSIAQNEIGHARAVYELLTDDADALAFDRAPEEYRCAPLVELHLMDWAHAIARRWLYEVADEIRITALMEEPPVPASPRRSTARRHTTACTRRCGTSGCATSRASTLRSTSCGRTRSACCRPSSAGRSRLASASTRSSAVERGAHDASFAALQDEMTMVRRSAPAGAQW